LPRNILFVLLILLILNFKEWVTNVWPKCSKPHMGHKKNIFFLWAW
jgi:hypothetical protein